MKAIVMAGGEGTRLRPLTLNTPKPLIPLCNKPVMEYTIEKLRQHGITDIIVTLHYLADEIMTYFENGKDFGVNIMYSVEDEPLGTAGSIKKIENLLKETFLIISGDAIADFDFSKIIQYHHSKKNMATVTLCKVDNPLEYGVTITDEESNIVRFIEKPTWGEVFSDTVNTGIYCLEPKILGIMELGKVYDFSNDIFSYMLEKGMPINGYTAEGYWCDIGKIHQYSEATRDLLLQKTNVTFSSKEIKPGIWIGDNCRIDPSAQISGPVIIGKNCRIEAGAVVKDHSSIGDNCIISTGSIIERSIIWSNSYIGKFSYISGTIIGNGVTARENVITQEGAIIGDKSLLGRQSQVNSNVTIWPEKTIAPGAIVSMSLIWGGKWLGSIFGNDGISGLINVEITPDFALKLGSAFAAFFDKATIIVISRDDHPASRMITRAIVCGFSSSGIETWDLRVLPISVARHAVNISQAQAGVHVRINPRDPQSVIIEFFDSNGITINKKTERKIENILSREDFRRSTFDEIGEIHFPARITENYTENYLKSLNVDAIGKRSFKAVIDYGFSSSSATLPFLLGKLGCEAVSINAYTDPERESQYNKKGQVSQLSKVVTTLGANIGILFDSDAESLFVVDETGQKISGSRLLALLAFLIFKTSPGSKIAVPVAVSSIIEHLAYIYGGEVIRTKTSKQELMTEANKSENKVTFAGNSRGEFIFPNFSPGFDGLYTFAKILELLSVSELSLSEAARNIPQIYTSRAQIECPSSEKGTYMRKLYQNFRHNPTDTTDGLKIYFEKSWVLAVPDNTEPLILLKAEAENQKKAEELVGSLKDMVNCTGDTKDPLPPKFKNSEDKVKETSGIRKRFFFWVPGSYLGISAVSVPDFISILSSINIESIKYHIYKGDFEVWLKKYANLSKDSLSRLEKLKGLKLSEEKLRETIISIFKTQDKNPIQK